MKKSSCEPGNRKRPLLVILSGPSGAGKDAVLARMREMECHLERIVTVTTRPPRPGERDKLDYRFVSPEKFQEMLKQGEFLEWAGVYGNHYGVPRGSVRDVLEGGRDAIIKVDVQGAATIKRKLPEAVFIFLVPPSMQELVTRLKQRDTESPGDIAMRFNLAADEIKRLSLFDYVVVNPPGEIDRAVADIRAIITAERCRVTPREVTLQS